MDNERLGAIIIFDILNNKLKANDWKIKLNTALGDKKLKTIEKHVYIRINTLKASDSDLKGFNLSKTCVPNVYYLDVKNQGHSKSSNDQLNAILKNSSLMEKIKIQNLSSCFPAFILNLTENSIVIDCASAPGNKTTHLCSIMNNTGRIYAFEKSFDRFNLLRSQIDLYGATNTRAICKDFLEVDPNEYNPDYILLDPGCSGSGIHLKYEKDPERIKSLHNFQVMILNHAFNFRAKKVVYSVCSLHQEEGEDVAK